MQRVEPQCGVAFQLLEKQLLTVTDLEGEQVADLVAFSAVDAREYLSSGRSLDFANTIYLTTGSVLYSNRSRPLFTIVADDVGRHDFLLTPCSPETFQLIYWQFRLSPKLFRKRGYLFKAIWDRARFHFDEV